MARFIARTYDDWKTTDPADFDIEKRTQAQRSDRDIADFYRGYRDGKNDSLPRSDRVAYRDGYRLGRAHADRGEPIDLRQ
jgi:hypothetical protein